MTDHPSIAGIPLCLGGNTFGWTSSDDDTFAVLDAFYEAGGRMIDTAQGYSVWVEGHVGGESETAIGKWLAARGIRSEMRIATKIGMAGKAGDLEPGRIGPELEKSLERLQTDYVDLYYAHRDDPQTPLDEVAGSFDALVQAGKVRELGASNFTAERLTAAIAAAEAGGYTPYSVIQNEYNLINRDQFEGDLQQLCIERDIASLSYFGLASGFLTGKYRSKEDLAQSVRGPGIAGYFDRGLPVLAVLDEVVAETGASHSAVALAWIIAQPGMTAPIAGARVAEQVVALVEGTKLTLTEDQLQRLTAAGA